MRDINGDNNKNLVIENGKTVNGDNLGIIADTVFITDMSNNTDHIEYKIHKGKIAINWKALTGISGSISIVSFLGLISSLITIFQSLSFDKLSNSTIMSIFLLLFAISFCSVITLMELKRRRIISIFSDRIFGFQLGLFNDGKVAKLKIISKCKKPNCGGKLRFFYNKNNDKYYFVCKRNSSQHRFEFDFTLLKF